jgi:quinol monooxygenase YgiN
MQTAPTNAREMTTTPVRMTLKWCVPPGESRPIAAALQGLMVAARAARGCVNCSLTTSMAEQMTISYVEDWRTEEDLRRELRSDRFTALAELLESASGHPSVEFSLPEAVLGLEYAHQVRNTPES